MSKPDFSHLDEAGQARMVDVSQKASSHREARARAVVELTPEIRAALLAAELPKGEALAVARLAGIQAAKDTSRLIPLCHPLALSVVEVTFGPVAEAGMEVRSMVRCVGPTGVEMEALTAVTVAALTLYDMCKALSRDIRITDVELWAKSGGRSGDWQRPQHPGEAGA